MEKYQKYPILNHRSLIEKIISTLGKFPIICPVCGKISFISKIDRNNFRETCNSHCCNSTNRQRQIAYILCGKLGLNSLSKIEKYPGIIYNTESFGSVHNQLAKNKHYISSEYFGEKYKSGQIVNGFLHQDLMKLSFENNSLDYILSSDVFEHIANPYKAHHEIYRVLKKGGSHIFTVPFLHNQILDDKRAIISADKIKILKEVIYHLDGVRPKEGALVFTHFSMEMLVELSKIGFNVQMYKIFNPVRGIIGYNAFVFCATK